jgi:hypothetical protein
MSRFSRSVFFEARDLGKTAEDEGRRRRGGLEERVSSAQAWILNSEIGKENRI